MTRDAGTGMSMFRVRHENYGDGQQRRRQEDMSSNRRGSWRCYTTLMMVLFERRHSPLWHPPPCNKLLPAASHLSHVRTDSRVRLGGQPMANGDSCQILAWDLAYVH